MSYQPKTGQPCSCRRGVQRDNCPACEGTGQRIDFAAIRARSVPVYSAEACTGFAGWARWPSVNREGKFFYRRGKEFLVMENRLTRRWEVTSGGKKWGAFDAPEKAMEAADASAQ